jgi:hypothetical protein
VHAAAEPGDLARRVQAAGAALGVRLLTDLAGETALAAVPALADTLADTLLGRLDPKSTWWALRSWIDRSAR